MCTLVINSYLTLMDIFYLDLQAAGQSSKNEVWHLVYAFVWCFFRSCAKCECLFIKLPILMMLLNNIILWEMAQLHRICGEFIVRLWWDHPVMSGAIIFSCSVPWFQFLRFVNCKSKYFLLLRSQKISRLMIQSVLHAY